MIVNYWNPTDKELQDVIDSCLPLDDKFGDRVFDLILDGATWASACLNVFYEIRDKLGKECPKSFGDMVEGYESGVENLDFE